MSLLMSMLYWLVWNWALWGCINFFGKVWPELKGLAYTIVKKGVYLHELFHYLMMKALCMKVSVADIRVENGAGSVAFKKTGFESPLKIVLVSLAPWVIGALTLDYLIVFFASIPATSLVALLLWNILKYWLILMVLLVLTPSFGDFRLIFQTIGERYLVFLKQATLMLVAFYGYVNNWGHIGALRDAIFAIDVPNLAAINYYLNPIAEYLCMLVLFGLLDLAIWLVKVGGKGLYGYYSKDRKYRLKPTEFLAYLGNDFIRSEIRPREPTYLTATDLAGQPEHDVSHQFQAEMQKNA